MHYSLFTVRCIYQLTSLTRLSLIDATFQIDEKVAIDQGTYIFVPFEKIFVPLCWKDL